MTRTSTQQLCLLCLFVLFTPTLMAQTVNGIVKLRNSDNQRLPSVAVELPLTHQTVKTDTFGRFQFPFLGKFWGDMLTLSAQKDGYRLINADELTRPLPFENDSIKIVLAKAADLTVEMQILQKMAAPSEELLNAQIQHLKTLSAPSDSQKTTLTILSQRLKFLTDSRDNVLAELQAIDPDEGSGRLREAYSLLLQKRFEKGVDVLTNTQTEVVYASNVQKRVDLRYKTHLLWLIGEVEEATKGFQELMAIDTSHFETLMAFSQFWRQQNALDSAKFYTEKAIRSVRRDLQTAAYLPSVWQPQMRLGGTMKQLAQIEIAQNNPESATEALRIALYCSEKVLVHEPSVARRLEHSALLRLLGDLCKKNRDALCVQESFDKAFGILKSISVQNTPPQYLPQLADTWQSWGNLLAEQNDLSAAAELLNESVVVRRHLFQDKPTETQRRVALATVLQQLALTYKQNRQFPLFEATSLESIQHIEALAQTQAKQYMPQLMQHYSSLAAHFLSFRKLALSDTIFEKSLALRQKMSDDTEGRENVRKWAVFQKETAAWLTQRARTFVRLGEKRRALRAYERADSLHRLLALVDAAVYEPTRTEGLNESAGLWLDMGKLDAAERTLAQVMRLMNKHQNGYDFSQIRALAQARQSRLFRLFYEQKQDKNDLDSAKYWLEAAKKSIERLTVLRVIEATKALIVAEESFHQFAKKPDLPVYKMLSDYRFDHTYQLDRGKKAALAQQFFSTAQSFFLKDTVNDYKKRLYTEGVAQFGLAELSVGHLALAEKYLGEALKADPAHLDWQRAYAHALALQGKEAPALKGYTLLIRQDNDQRTDILGDLEQFGAEKIGSAEVTKTILEKLRSNSVFWQSANSKVE